MASSDRSLSLILELSIRSADPRLLAGLDAWLQLGLLSDEIVRQIGREQLSCRLPQAQVVAPEPADFLPAVPVPRGAPVLEAPASLDGSASAPPPPSLVARLVQSFIAELSVVWLLFLGVFLVVVSSGVLAVSQWQNFSPVGQYAILFGYTLAFWGTSLWSGKQSNLRLTARMLTIATLLIIPVNIWMMDGLGLGKTGGGQAMAAIATLVLTAITAQLLRPAGRDRSHSWLLPATAIGLSGLHWGWRFAGIPLLATYLGTIGASLVLLYQDRRDRSLETLEEPENRELSVGWIAIAVGVLLLLARALFAAQVPVHQLGLAAGISGALLVWLARQDRSRILVVRTGVGLLLAGWLVTVGVNPPWQAIGVSGLGLVLLADYLRRTQQRSYLSVGFLVGLQANWLLWRLVPPGWQQQLLAGSTQLTGPEGMPLALMGLGLFPYLLLTVGLSLWLRQRQRLELVQLADFWALLLGTGLVVVSSVNPLVRSLNLICSALTLGWLSWQLRPASRPLVYLTHATGLAALAATIYQLRPGLEPHLWASLLLLGMLLEWGYSAVFAPFRSETDPAYWQQSAWYAGLFLAGVSYLLLGGTNLLPLPLDDWKLLWLATPIALTLLGYHRRFAHPLVASRLSVVALFASQILLTDNASQRLIGLGTALVLMVCNTAKIQTLATAVITLGFGLGFGGVAAYEGLTWLGLWTVGIALNLLTGMILLLWLGRDRLVPQSDSLPRLYRRALDGWAIVLTTVALLALTVTLFLVYAGWTSSHGHYGLACGLVFLATVYRSRLQPTNWGLGGIAFSLELLVASLLSFTAPTLEALGTANLALGLGTQLLGDWWLTSRRASSTAALARAGSEPGDLTRSLTAIPLGYAFLGLLLQHVSFTAYTGLFTLTLALVLLGVGRRKPIKFLVYLGMAFVSIAAYELLIYQLAQAKGGNAGDGVVLLAALAALLGVGQRLLQRWLLPYLRLTASELLGFAHLHWGLGSALLPLAIALSLSSTGQWLWLLVLAILTLYALTLGNRYLLTSPDLPSGARLTWTYLGILELLVAVAQLLRQFWPDTLLLPWAAAISAVIASIFYRLPWQQWGWPRRPWSSTATILPIATVLLTANPISWQSLLLVAAFYAWFARAEQQIRLSYLAVGLIDWAILRLLHHHAIAQPLWYALLLGGSLLFVAQVDPALQASTERDRRHLLRSLATASISLMAIYQAEIGLPGVAPILVSLLAVGLHLALALAGLILRVRAFLFVGTIAFVLQVLRQLWRFISDYSLLLWALGIALGLLLIWVAATFEARRSQVSVLLQHWVSELDTWE